MAMIGYLGTGAGSGIQFVVSSGVFRTPKNLNWNGSARYATHERHATYALTEFTGVDPEQFSFDILLTAELGVNPQNDITKILSYERSGAALGLVIGGMAYGKYRWTIKSHKTKIEHTNRAGNMYAVEVSVDLLEYLGGKSHNTTKKKAKEQPEEKPKEESKETPAANSGGTAYTVKKGDCLWAIAQKFYGSGTQYNKIQEANQNIISGHNGGPNMIWPGDVLTIPKAQSQ